MKLIGVFAHVCGVLTAAAVLVSGNTAFADAPLLWTQRGPSLMPLNPPMYTTFGRGADFAGDTAVIGANGAAYAFKRSGGSWAQQGGPLISDTLEQFDQFGAVLALSGDTVAITASAWGGATTFNQGAAYVFVRSGGNWAQQGPGLVASDGQSNFKFGSAVALDGDTLVVGSSQFCLGSATDQINRGAAYVFVRSGTSWTQQAELLANDGTFYDEFGYSVAIAGDTVLVGAHNKTIGGNTYQGAAYVFVRSGSTWTQQARLVGANGAANDFLGSSVALSGDTALVGAEYKTENGHTFQGAAYVFVRSGTSWTQQGSELVASDGQASDYLGDLVSISGDVAVLGSALGRGEHGLAYVFTRSGGSWTQQGPSLELNEPSTTEMLGGGLALDGDTLLLSATYQPNDPIMGAAYFFSDDCATDAECGKSGYCDAAGKCRLGVAQGGACDASKVSACTSSGCRVCGSGLGGCFDGVCCDKACGGACEACSQTLNGVADGTCLAVPADQDPKNACALGSSQCGADGACDGSGQCRAFAKQGTPCAVTECVAGTVTGHICDGNGICLANGVTACAPYVCAGSACTTSCASDADCAAAAFCLAGSCTVKKALGAACSTSAMCESGYCVDGVCCNSACSGQCSACAESGSVGTCHAVSGAPRGARTACAVAAGSANDAACAGSCDGVNAYGCALPGAETTCATSCADGRAGTRTCDGQGACRPCTDAPDAGTSDGGASAGGSAGSNGGAGAGASAGSSGGAGSGAGASSGAGTSSAGSAGSAGGSSDANTKVSDAGCSCRVGQPRASRSLAVSAFWLVLAWGAARRRRR